MDTPLKNVEDGIVEKLDLNIPCTAVNEEVFLKMGTDLVLPDYGKAVMNLAKKFKGGAFDPRYLENISIEELGYKAKWSVVRFEYYGLEWDITGLRLEALNNNEASKLPWVIIINGGSANFYEFFLDPLNNPGLGQYLAQKINVLLVTIPGNFKYGGWDQQPQYKKPQYLFDREIFDEEINLRNAIYTNRLLLAGLQHISQKETKGDIVIVGHSTSGDLNFLAMADKQLHKRIKGRFLGWGSGGPANLCKEWEEEVNKRQESIQIFKKYPPLSQLRYRNAEEYVDKGYIGPLNPCFEYGIEKLKIAERWLDLEQVRRPNFKQVIQDMEHWGVLEFKPMLEKQIYEQIKKTKIVIKVEEVFKDLFIANTAPLTGYKKMVWMVAKWDKRHWNKENVKEALELTIAEKFRKRNKDIPIKILLFDMPLTHYGHIEKPQQLAGCFIDTLKWLIK